MNVADATPLWPSELTAWGTLAVAVAAVAVALFAEWRASVRVKDERKRSDKILADERMLADKRLAEERERHDQETAEERKLADARLKAQMEHSDEQLRQEREAAEARLQEERDLAQEREQNTGAWAVQVVGGRISQGEDVVIRPELQGGRPVAIVINRSAFTITRVEARFSNGLAFVGGARDQPYVDFSELPPGLARDIVGVIGDVYRGVLTSGSGIRFIGSPMQLDMLRTTHPVVRWWDHLDTIWEHKQGRVRQIKEGDKWTP